jgi:purine-binding chemotaxis protein CheW
MIQKSTYVFFKIEQEFFAVDVQKVIEIIEIPELTIVPKSPSFLKGISLFRGKILPIIDLKQKFKLTENYTPEKQYVIVISYTKEQKQQIIGFLIDQLIDVVKLSQLEINEFPEIGSKYNIEFIEGIVKQNENIYLILNTEKILDSAEIDIINHSSKQLNLLEKLNKTDESKKQ